MEPFSTTAQTLERTMIKIKPIAESFREILLALGEDAEREGLKDTPVRYERMMKELFTLHPFKFTTFEVEGDAQDQMIIVKDIPFFSLCEHHCLPFFGTAAVAYIPNQRIVGLSKLPRLVGHFAAGMQNQERITDKVAEYIWKNEELNCKGAAVMLQARHLCMEMRGVKTFHSITTTTALRGVFFEDAQAKNEFISAVPKAVL